MSGGQDIQGCDISSRESCRTKRTNPIGICIWFGYTKFAIFPWWYCIFVSGRTKRFTLFGYVSGSKIQNLCISRNLEDNTISTGWVMRLCTSFCWHMIISRTLVWSLDTKAKLPIPIPQKIVHTKTGHTVCTFPSLIHLKRKLWCDNEENLIQVCEASTYYPVTILTWQQTSKYFLCRSSPTCDRTSEALVVSSKPATACNGWLSWILK